MSDTKLIVAIGMLHLVALAAGGGLVLLALRGGDGYEHPHAEGGRGPDQPPDPPRRPIGGPPLPSARPARIRLREPARLADLHPPAAASRAAGAEATANQASEPPSDVTAALKTRPSPRRPQCSADCLSPSTVRRTPNGP